MRSLIKPAVCVIAVLIGYLIANGCEQVFGLPWGIVVGVVAVIVNGTLLGAAIVALEGLVYDE